MGLFIEGSLYYISGNQYKLEQAILIFQDMLVENQRFQVRKI